MLFQENLSDEWGPAEPCTGIFIPLDLQRLGTLFFGEKRKGSQPLC